MRGAENRKEESNEKYNGFRKEEGDTNIKDRKEIDTWDYDKYGLCFIGID